MKKEIYSSITTIMVMLCSSCELAEPEETNKQKYLVEEANWTTYSSRDADEVNVVNKVVLDRGANFRNYKFVNSRTYYKNDELQFREVARNMVNADVWRAEYPADLERNYIEIWYDDERTKLDRYLSEDYIMHYTYAVDGKLLGIREYSEDVLVYETNYTYDGLVQYVNAKCYSGMDAIVRIMKSDTVEYTDYTFTQKRRSSGVKKSFNSEGELVIITAIKEVNDVGAYGPTRIERTAISYMPDGEKMIYDSSVKHITWLGELYCEFTQENTYTDYFSSSANYQTRSAGYQKYVK